LISMLLNAGHEVTGTTRSRNKADSIRAAGARPEVVNALSRQEVLDAIQRTQPDVIIHQLTAIPPNFNLKRFDEAFASTNRLRTEGTDNLLAAARSVGCRRFIAQSYVGWPYTRAGGWIKTEDDPLVSSPEPAMKETFRAIVHVESAVLGDRTIEGFVLRYGSFYGPGTSLGQGGSLLEEIRGRRVPIVGKGTGYWSFVHIDDAASATCAAVEAGRPGLYNICDDEPAPGRERRHPLLRPGESLTAQIGQPHTFANQTNEPCLMTVETRPAGGVVKAFQIAYGVANDGGAEDGFPRNPLVRLRRDTRSGQLQHEPEQGDDGELVPRYEMLSPSQSRWNAGLSNGAATAVSYITFYFLCTFARVPAGACLFNLI
jgi:nucleoside-diphosphate-sugar epimerase